MIRTTWRDLRLFQWFLWVWPSEISFVSVCHQNVEGSFYASRHTWATGDWQRFTVYITWLPEVREGMGLWTSHEQPHHSQGNGKEESAVKEAKKILRKCRASGSDAFLALLELVQHSVSSTEGLRVSYQWRQICSRHRQFQITSCAEPSSNSTNSDKLSITTEVLSIWTPWEEEMYVVRLKPFQQGIARMAQTDCAKSTGWEIVWGRDAPSCDSSQPRSPTKDKWAVTATITPGPCWGVCSSFTAVQWVGDHRSRRSKSTSSSQENAPLCRPEVASTAAESPPKPVLRRSEHKTTATEALKWLCFD